MTWIQFLWWMLCIYSFYYASVFLFDFMKYGKANVLNAKETSTLHLSPEIVAEIISDLNALPDEDEIDYFSDEGESEPASFSLGGVSLKELFELAKNESIEFTRQVSF